MIKFITKLIKIIFVLLVSFIIFALIFSIKNSIPFERTISYFQSMITNNTDSNENSGNNTTNSDGLAVSTTPSNTNYYYSQLDDTSKIIYNSLESNINNLKKENYVIDFSDSFSDLLKKSTGQYKLNKSFQSALDAFFYEHPELFYIDLTKITLNIKTISLGPLKTYHVEIVPRDGTNYLSSEFKSAYDVNVAISKVENIKNSLIKSVAEENTYNKIRKLHDELVNSIEYDSTQSKPNTHNIYGALVEKEVVCEGYAKAFKYLMDAIGIECILVGGTASGSDNESESHMWNYVKLNNEWYGVDVTWDDPIIIGGSNLDNLRHDYFLKGRRTFNADHVPNGKITSEGKTFIIPSLSSTNYIW